MAGDFGRLNAQEVSVTLENKAAGIEPIARVATRAEAGTCQVNNLSIPIPGRWDIRLDILVNDFEKILLDGSVDIGP
jgi:copper transport protein